MTQLCMIAAVANNGVIGNNGDIPWSISEDLQHFRKTTMGYPCIMGRHTYESIGGALPGRTCVVVSRTVDDLPDVIVVKDLRRALELTTQTQAPKVFVIGGETLYEQTDHLATELYLTVIDRDYEGDTFFPGFSQGTLDPMWVLQDSTPSEILLPDGSTLTYSFRHYTKKSS